MSEMDVPAADLGDYEPAAEEDRDIEAPEADAAEQRAEADHEERADEERLPGRIPSDVNEADAAEQHRTVEQDDEDYR